MFFLENKIFGHDLDFCEPLFGRVPLAEMPGPELIPQWVDRGEQPAVVTAPGLDDRAQPLSVGLQVYPYLYLPLGRQVELGEDPVDVLFRGLGGDHEALGDGRVGLALGHQREDLPRLRDSNWRTTPGSGAVPPRRPGAARR